MSTAATLPPAPEKQETSGEMIDRILAKHFPFKNLSNMTFEEHMLFLDQVIVEYKAMEQKQ